MANLRLVILTVCLLSMMCLSVQGRSNCLKGATCNGRDGYNKATAGGSTFCCPNPETPIPFNVYGYFICYCY
ncbi:hypothetical protein V1264_024658 [Littorina saxatilis]|uniref:Uncharacterized protein n=1 Tax=Littorina saxatilis TaxID=31220 RepID=A0AAN9ALI3_9CAEN